jgi:pimeloyl-ACP methyl ester carboxylesterase
MDRNKILIILPFLLIDLNVRAQDTSLRVNDTVPKNYPEDFLQVEIISKMDNSIQPAIFYKTSSSEKKPLIIALHSWSGNYLKRDPRALKIKELNWNYIHPDFRGRNNTPEACGSPLVVSDIEDAIDFAIKNSNVDETQIHIIGGSGGAYATLISYMKIGHKIKSFSAWNPITNLIDWYYESLGRQERYADDIFKATSSDKELNMEEAIKRSPVFMDYPGGIREEAKLYIYHGIHDGYLGSVPISHSLNFYNELIKQIDSEEQHALISEKDIMDLLVKRCYPLIIENYEMLGDRKIHYKRNYKNIQIIIFEGRHEFLGHFAVDLIPIEKE